MVVGKPFSTFICSEPPMCLTHRVFTSLDKNIIIITVLYLPQVQWGFYLTDGLLAVERYFTLKLSPLWCCKSIAMSQGPPRALMLGAYWVFWNLTISRLAKLGQRQGLGCIYRAAFWRLQAQFCLCGLILSLKKKNFFNCALTLCQ